METKRCWRCKRLYEGLSQSCPECNRAQVKEAYYRKGKEWQRDRMRRMRRIRSRVSVCFDRRCKCGNPLRRSFRLIEKDTGRVAEFFEYEQSCDKIVSNYRAICRECYVAYLEDSLCL